MNREIAYVISLELDTSNESWQRSVKLFMEETGRSAYDFETLMRDNFKTSLENLLRGELGGEGIHVTVDHYEDKL